jgi:transposase
MNVAELRAVLKVYHEITDGSDTFIDLKRALGKEPGYNTVLTHTQSTVIEWHLIQGQEIGAVAASLGVDVRVAYSTECRGLKRLLKFLATGDQPRPNRYSGWTPTQTAKLLELKDLPRAEIAKRLNRSVQSIYNKLSELKANERKDSPR